MELVEEVGAKPISEVVALGTGTAITMAVWLDENGKIHVAIEGKGYYTFGHYASWTYVREKLFNHKYDPDAKSVANFINTILGYGSDKMESLQ